MRQVGETEPFISELLTGLTGIIQDLETHQIHMFYEAVGLMIGAETSPERRDEYLVRSIMRRQTSQPAWVADVARCPPSSRQPVTPSSLVTSDKLVT
jgi:hypothetical protein